MRNIFHRHKSLWSKKSFCLSVLIGFCLLAASLFLTYYSNIYTGTRVSNWVTDILLDNLPVVNVNFIYNEGAAVFLIILVIIGLQEPRRIPFLLKGVGVFILIRSLFTMLTHLAPPPHQSYLDTSDLMYKMSSVDDLFFSGHAGLPFFLALVFWREKYLKYFFLFATGVGAVAVLLGHLHYSIDVFSAFFIAFGIFHISRKFFAEDYKLLRVSENIK